MDYSPLEFSQDLKLVNYSKSPIYVIDSSSYQPVKIDPSINQDPTFANAICIKSVSSVIDVTNPAIASLDPRHNARIRKIVDGPPENAAQVCPDWSFVDVRSGFVIFVTEEKAEKFFRLHKGAFDYFLNSKGGTVFKTSANYGILNCTGKTLYIVDDVGINESNVESLITEIPANYEEPIAPMYAAQIDNNCNVINSSKPYVRIYRANNEINNGNYYGRMSEEIREWIPENLDNDGFMYIDNLNVCLFEDINIAKTFINTYTSVHNYGCRKFLADNHESLDNDAALKQQELEKIIDEKNKELEDTKSKLKKIFIGVGILLSANSIPIIWAWAKNKIAEDKKGEGLTMSSLTNITNQMMRR